MNSVIARAWTEASGQFRFNGVPSGRLSVLVIPSGTDYAQQSQEFEISGIGVRGQPLPDNIRVEFNLRPLKPSAATTNAVVLAQEVPD